jgi:hypothetical protein
MGNGIRKKTCGACGAVEGQIHNDFCDMEPCPICGDQVLYCDCDVEAKFSKRVPFIQFPNMCDYCGKTWPDMFTDKDWKRVLPEIWWDKFLCFECWAYIKELLTGKKLSKNEVEWISFQ